MSVISFLYPKFLLLLLLVPLFIFIYFFSFIYTKKKAVVFGNFEALERISDVEFFSKNFIALYTNIAILCLLVFSLAGTSIDFNANTSDYSYIIAIDNSGSMRTSDIPPTRLDAAKIAGKEFIDLLPVGTEAGVLAFSGDAVVMQELDTSKLKNKLAVDSIDFGNVQGTNVYNVLLTANKLFDARRMKSVVIISDGQLNVGDAPQIVRYANRNSIIINTIAIGTREGGLTEFNTISKVDEDFLKALAFESGGKFFRAQDLPELRDSFEEIALNIDKNVSIDISFYLLLITLILFTFNWIISNFRFKSLP